MTDDVLLSHLKGEVTVGIYQIESEKNIVKWLCSETPFQSARSGIVLYSDLTLEILNSYVHTSSERAVPAKAVPSVPPL